MRRVYFGADPSWYNAVPLLAIYDNDSVIGATLSPDEEIYDHDSARDVMQRHWPVIKKWFTEGDSRVSRGLVKRTGDAVSFTLRSAEGEVDYTGVMTQDALLLKWHSRITGVRMEMTYWVYRETSDQA